MESISPSDAMVYEFEMPQTIVGRLIGRFGNFVNKIKEATGASIIVKVHHTTSSLKICAIEGMCSEIDEALAMIRDRFPSNTFPYLSLEQVNYSSQPALAYLPSNNKLSLNEGIVNDIVVTKTITLDHIFVQQPTHPTYTALSRMHKLLSTVYEQDGIPQLVRPFNSGVICVTRIKKDEWVRAEVVAVQEDKDEVTARLVDVGGYIQVPIEDLRQIRVDFVSIPFQATECRLANLVPVDENGWSEEALKFFKLLTQGQILSAYVVGYSPGDSTTLIHLYRPNADHSYTLINGELVSNGYARWVEETEYYYVSSDGTESGEEMWSSSGENDGDQNSSIEGIDQLSSIDQLSLEGNDQDHSSVEGHDEEEEEDEDDDTTVKALVEEKVTLTSVAEEQGNTIDDPVSLKAINNLPITDNSTSSSTITSKSDVDHFTNTVVVRDA